MRQVLILDCKEIACPPVLIIVFQELCGALERRGYSVRIARELKEIHDECIVFMGDFFNVPDPGTRLADVSKNAIYIGWYWHKQDVSMLPYFLHIHENVMTFTPGLMHDKIDVMAFMQEHVNTCPLLLRANEDPIMIGTYERTRAHDYCFMGGRMCDWLLPRQFHGVYHGVHDVKLYIPYEERRQIYLSSTFALGFQTDDNIRNGHVSQRIFEALAYGCIVLSHSMHACQQTEGLVEYVEPIIEKIEERMIFFLQHPEYVRQKQERGYDFIRRKGTNVHAIDLICDKIRSLYNLEI
jgi:hypothetical protein